MFGVCVCVLLIYSISISTLCVSWEERSLNETNQQICSFYKWVIFESKNIVELCKFVISTNYLFNLIQIATGST